MTKTKILFLLKENYDYGSYLYCKAGLLNSARLTAHELYTHSHELLDTKVEICIDGNSIDKEVHDFAPDYCILEAIWVTPTKLLELSLLHPKVNFVVRIHSKVPFLATEGTAIEWIKEFQDIPGVAVAFNNRETAEEFEHIIGETFYLPNLYHHVHPLHMSVFEKYRTYEHRGHSIDIGCFGAIRPLKNQLEQAFAAIIYANKHNFHLRFHVNNSRQEQNGQSVLKNIRSLFEDSSYELIEHPWMSREDFLRVIRQMDIGLQVSLTESFNIVTADFVSQKIPIVVSPDISWMPDINKVDPLSAEKIALKIEEVMSHYKYVAGKSIEALNSYINLGVRDWMRFIF